MSIQIIEDGNKGKAIANDGETIMGEMTYSIANKDFIIIDHTEVNDLYKGQNVGKKMLYMVVDMVREKDLKVLPLCPFARGMFNKYDDIKDVLK